MFGLFGRKAPAPDPAPAIAAIREHLGTGELRQGYGGPAYVGELNGYAIQIPERLERLIVRVAVQNPDTLASNVRFKNNGSVRRGQEAVAAMTPEGQAAIAALGALGATEFDSYMDDYVTVQLPHNQTPAEFAAALPAFLEQTGRLAAALGRPSLGGEWNKPWLRDRVRDRAE